MIIKNPAEDIDMVSQVPSPTQSEVIYPDSDGQPVANNTIQFRWIVEIQQNLDWLYHVWLNTYHICEGW